MGCIGCGEVFVNINRQNLCARCLEKYDRVRKCLNKNSNITVKELVELLDGEINVNFIKRLIDAELIELGEKIEGDKRSMSEEKHRKFVESLRQSNVVHAEERKEENKKGQSSKNRKSVVSDINERQRG